MADGRRTGLDAVPPTGATASLLMADLRTAAVDAPTGTTQVHRTADVTQFPSQLGASRGIHTVVWQMAPMVAAAPRATQEEWQQQPTDVEFLYLAQQVKFRRSKVLSRLPGHTLRRSLLSNYRRAAFPIFCLIGKL